jgi:hypothetical protein
MALSWKELVKICYRYVTIDNVETVYVYVHGHERTQWNVMTKDEWTTFYYASRPLNFIFVNLNDQSPNEEWRSQETVYDTVRIREYPRAVDPERLNEWFNSIPGFLTPNF